LSLGKKASVVVDKVKEFRSKIYELIEKVTGPLNDNVKIVCDVLISLLAITLIIWILRKMQSIVDFICDIAVSLFGTLAEPVVKNIRRFCHIIFNTCAIADDLASGTRAFFQATSSSIVLCSFLCLGASVLSGGGVKPSKGMTFDFLRNVMPAAGLVDAVFSHFDKTINWLIALVNPNSPLLDESKTLEKFEKIRVRTGEPVQYEL